MRKTDEPGEIPYEKSWDIETSLLLTKGRIVRKNFFRRTLLCLVLWTLMHLAYTFIDTPNYEKWVTTGGGRIQRGAAIIGIRHKIVETIDFYCLPSLLLFFVAIQAIKRAHDCNRSGVWLLVPGYNIYLLLKEGDNTDNDYGRLPNAEVKSPKYTPPSSASLP